MKTLDDKEKIMQLKADCDLYAKKMFSDLFLKETGLQVGDTVKCYFSFSTGNSDKAYHSGGELPGILKDDNGVLYVESVEPQKKARECHHKYGRGKSWWAYDMVHVRAELVAISKTEPK